MKIDIDQIIHIISEVGVDDEKQKEIIARLAETGEAEKAEKSATRKKRKGKEYIVTLKSGHDLSNLEIVASVWEMPQDSDPATFISKLQAATVDQNNDQSKKKNELKTFSDALNFGKPKYQKAHGIKRIFKDWVATQQINENFLS